MTSPGEILPAPAVTQADQLPEYVTPAQFEMMVNVLTVMRLDKWNDYKAYELQETLADIARHGWVGYETFTPGDLAEEYVELALFDGDNDADHVMRLAAVNGSLTVFDFERKEVWEYVVAHASMHHPEDNP